MATYIQTLGDNPTILNPTEDIPIRLDISTVENGEIGEVFGDLGQTFQVAATEEANRYFQHAFDVGGQIVPGTSRSVPVALNTDDSTILTGTMSLTDWSPEDGLYSLTIQSSIIPLTEALGDKLLSGGSDDETSDLWDDTDHTYSIQRFIDTNSMSDISTQNYIYPFQDLGFDSEGRPRVPDDVTLERSSASTQQNYNAGYTDAFGNYNASEYQEQYNTVGVSYGFGSGSYISNRTMAVISPSRYFGEVGFGTSEVQGYINHPSTPFRVDQTIPAYKLKVVLDKIFEIAGSTYTAGFLPMLDDVFIQPKTSDGLGVINDIESTTDGFVARDLQGSSTSVPVSDFNKGGLARESSRDVTVYKFGDGSGTIQDFGDTGNFNNGTYTCPIDGTYEFRFTGEIENARAADNLFNNAYLELKVAIKKNGTIVEAFQFPRIGNNASLTDDFDLTHTGNFNEGDVVTAEVISDARRGADDRPGGSVNGASFRTNRTPLAWEGLSLKSNLQWGDITASEMLSAIVQKFNLVIVKNKNLTDDYILMQYYDWVLAGDRTDWSDRVSNLRYQPLLSEQETVIDFTDSEDDDRISKITQDLASKRVYGSLKVTDNESDLTSGDREIGGFFGALSVAAPSLAGDRSKNITPSPENGIPHLYEWDGEDASAMSTEVRIGYKKKVSLPLGSTFYYADSGNRSIRYNQSAVQTLSNINDDGDSDLNWSSDFALSDSNATGAYDKYWKDYIDHLYNPSSRKLICDVSFTPQEYKDLNINDTIHIRGNDYLINKISGFNLSNPDVVEVELITYRNNFSTVFTMPRNRYIEYPPDYKTTVLGIKVNATNDEAGDGVQVPVVGALQADMFYYTFTGLPAEGSDPAEAVTQTLSINQSDQWEISASNFTSNAGTLPGITLSAFRDNGDVVEVDITVEAGSDHIYRELVITGEVDRITADSRTYEVTFQLDSSVTNATLGNATTSLRGNVDASGVMNVMISPSLGHQLDATTFVAEDLPEGMSLIGFSQLGLSVFATFQVIFQNTNRTHTVNLNGNAGTVVSGDIDTTAVSITFNESISNVSINRTSLVVSGFVGQRSPYSLYAYAADGFDLNSSNFSATENISWLTMYNAVGGGETVEIPFDIVFPSTDQSGTVSINGSAQQVGQPTISCTINTSNNISNTTVTETSETFILNHGQRLKYTNDIIPSSGYNIPASAVTVTESDDSSNIISNIRKSDDGDGSDFHIDVTAPNTGSAASATINLSGTATTEDHSIRFDINSQELTFAGTNMIQHIEGYDVSEAGTAFNFCFMVNSASNKGFTTTNLPTVTISTPQFANGAGNASIPNLNRTISNPDSTGNVEVCIGGQFPSTPNDIVVQVNVGNEPSSNPATTGAWSVTDVSYNRSARTVEFSYVANGIVSVSGSPSGIHTPLPDNSAGTFLVNLPQVSSDTVYTYNLLSGTSSKIISELTITQQMSVSSAAGGFTTTGWDLNAGPTLHTVFIYSDGMGQTRAAGVPGGDSISVCATSKPTIVSGSSGASVVQNSIMVCSSGETGTGDTYAQEAGDASTINGNSIVVNIGGAAGTQPNTIYFT